jgi:hypothetical protein
MAITTLLVVQIVFLFRITLRHPPGQSVESNHRASAGRHAKVTNEVPDVVFSVPDQAS